MSSAYDRASWVARNMRGPPTAAWLTGLLAGDSVQIDQLRTGDQEDHHDRKVTTACGPACYELCVECSWIFWRALMTLQYFMSFVDTVGGRLRLALLPFCEMVIAILQMEQQDQEK